MVPKVGKKENTMHVWNLTTRKGMLQRFSHLYDTWIPVKETYLGQLLPMFEAAEFKFPILYPSWKAVEIKTFNRCFNVK